MNEKYDVIIVGCGAGGLFAAYELTKLDSNKHVLVLEKGRALEQRKCPISEGRSKNCLKCLPCHIMSGYGGAGALSDGKYNITTEFGGELHLKIGDKRATELMEYVDSVLVGMSNQETKLYSTVDSALKTEALQNNLYLLDAKVRHFGTDGNHVIMEKMYDYTKENIDIRFGCTVTDVRKTEKGFEVNTSNNESYECDDLVLASGRSGSKWLGEVMSGFGVELKSNRVDIGLRLELRAEIWKHITDVVYESKIVYRTDKYNDAVRTFCMNPYGEVVTENTDGIVTVNGHSYADPKLHTQNTNFALLVTNQFTAPFKDSNEYGESIAKLSNMLGGGVLMQRFGDLVKGRRSSEERMLKSLTRPTLAATPGDLSLVMPKRQLDNIIEMIYKLDTIAPGTSNDDTLLYGVEVKFYNSEVEVDENLETAVPGLYAIGDASGVTHSLSQASASGVLIARHIAEKQ